MQKRTRRRRRIPKNDRFYAMSVQVPCPLCGYHGQDHLEKHSHLKSCAFHWMSDPMVRRNWLLNASR